MHIAINAQLLSFRQNYRNSGVSRYIRYLLTELARRPGAHQYTVFVNGPDIVEQLNARHAQMTYVPTFANEVQPAVRIAWEQLTLPTEIRRRHIDVLHSPVNVLPQWLPRSCASVVTLHDLAFLRLPGVLTRSRRFYHRAFTIRSLQRASMIISVSDSTKRDAVELVGIAPERLQTVYPCIDQQFSNVPIYGEVEAFRQKQGLTHGFILYLGTLEPRKNVPTLIDAFARLRTEYGRQEQLVIAGSKGWLYDSIFACVQQNGLQSQVLFPGFVSDSEQRLWYAAASAFVYPSLYEGFGIPVAEALACGIPVITSNVSSLPEAGAGIALTIDPYDSKAMAAAIHQALTDQKLQEISRTSAARVAKRFSAKTMVEQTLAVYERAASLHLGKERGHARQVSPVR